jgi:hypothetical protein
MLACYAMGFAIIAVGVLTLSGQVASRHRTVALRAAIFSAGVGIALGAAAYVPGVHLGFSAFYWLLAASYGVVGSTFLVVSAKRLGSPVHMAGIGIGLMVVATAMVWVVQFDLPDVFRATWLTANVIAGVGFLILGVTAAHAASRVQPETEISRPVAVVHPGLPLLDR